MGLKSILVAIDYVAIVFGLLWAYEWRLYMDVFPLLGDFKIRGIYLYVATPFLFILNLLIAESYEIEAPYWEKVKRVVKAVTLSVVASVFLMYAGKVTTDVSRIFVFLTWFTILFSILSFRYLIERICIALDLFYIPVLLIGAGKTAELAIRSIERTPLMRYKIIGFVDDLPKSEFLVQHYEHFGKVEDVEQVIHDTGVQTVLVCTPGMETTQLVRLITKLQLLVRKVAFIPDLFGLPAGNISARGLMDENAIVIRLQNNLARKSQRVLKRIFDFIVTLVGLIVISPIMIIIALLIRLSSPGPVVFAHRRVGQGGKEFPCYKFRSMIPNAQEVLEQYLAENPEAREEWERDFKLKNDPRITKIGAFLRKTSLDELPQLFNVLKGEMSLVGPRPIIRDEIIKYGEYIEDFYLVPPGVTGVWQVSGRSDTTYEERVLMDSWYVHNWSVWIDIVYLVKTVVVVLKRKGAY